MKLFDAYRAPNPRRVRWVMAEKGVSDIEVVNVDLMAGEHRSPEYRDRVGFAHVPALELDNGAVISESIAICRYLEALHPEPNLFGRSPEETAVVEMWMRRCEMYLATPMMLYVRHTHPLMVVLEAPRPGIADYNLENAERFMKSLDRRLADRDFIAAERVTIADITAFIGLDFARLVKYRAPESLANLHRWAETMRARPAAKAGV